MVALNKNGQFQFVSVNQFITTYRFYKSDTLHNCKCLRMTANARETEKEGMTNMKLL
jgi:hypothetical protein